MERKIKLKHWDENKAFFIADLVEWQSSRGIILKQYRVKKRVCIGFYKTLVTSEFHNFEAVDVIDLGAIDSSKYPLS